MTASAQTQESLGILYERIEQLSREGGAFKIGYADIKELKGMVAGDPSTFDFPNAVSIAVEIPKDAARSALKVPSAEMREAYKQCNKKLKRIGDQIAEEIIAVGYTARFIDPSERVVPDKLLGPISHKAIAHLAGLGWIGKNGLLISQEHGPRFRMGTVLTDMPVVENPPLLGSGCGECKICIENCPTSSLKDSSPFEDHPQDRELVIDWAKCGRYEKALIGDGTRAEQACGRCIATCPKSQMEL
jgi:epoxyqueuosine reductase QueG